MGYSIKSVQVPGAINTTYLYDTPEATKCDNPIRVETPEGVKYASTDLTTQKSFIKCVDEAGNIRRINSKGENVYVKIYEKTLTPGDGEVMYPMRGDYTPLSDDIGVIVGSNDESANYPLTISIETGSAFNIVNGQDRYNYRAEVNPSGRNPHPGLSIRVIHIFGIYGDVNPIYITFAITEFSGGAGSGIYDATNEPGGSGACKEQGDTSHCGRWNGSGCGCSGQRCSWSGCTAATMVEAGGLGMKADRCFTIPAINDPSFRAQLLGMLANTGLTRIDAVEYQCIFRVPAPDPQMWGSRGECTSTAGFCGSYSVGTYSGGGWGGCRGAGCTANTTNAKCSCEVSEAGTSINGVDGGWNGARIGLEIDGWSEEKENYSYSTGIQAKVTIESIR